MNDFDQHKTANGGFKKKKERKEPRPPKKITESYLHNSGLYYLQRFSSSSANFKTVMMRKVWKSCAHHEDQDKDECEALVDKTVVKFEELELLDDAAYTRGMVTSLRRRGLSKRAIANKLRVKGIEQSETLAALDKYEHENLRNPEEAEFIAALTMARKKHLGPFIRTDRIKPDMDDEERKKEFNKAMAKLARGGFQYNIVRRVFDMNLNDADQFLYDNA